jgi:LemA protein
MGIFIGILVVVAIYFIMIYNGLVTKKVLSENAWSQIDVQLKRRYDLIPNLIETVKGYTKHEQETLEKVIAARNSAISTGSNDIAAKSHAENQLSGALRQLFALTESYPDLKANQNFAQLQEELTTTENKISFARQHFNDAVGNYNAAILQFPANLIAGWGNFTQKQYYELDQAEAVAVQTAPKVSFN